MENEFNPGEIWESETDRNEPVYYLIVGVQKNICNVLKLKYYDEEHPEYTRGNIEVIAKGIMYTDAGMISYASKRKFTGFIRKLTDEEFSNVKISIIAMLGFNEFLRFDSSPVEDAEKKIMSLQEQVERVKAEKEMELGVYNGNLKMLGDSIADLESKLEESEKTRDGLMHEVDRLNAELMLKTQDTEENVKTQVERDFYKEQYEKLFALVTKNVYAV